MYRELRYLPLDGWCVAQINSLPVPTVARFRRSIAVAPGSTAEISPMSLPAKTRPQRGSGCYGMSGAEPSAARSPVTKTLASLGSWFRSTGSAQHRPRSLVGAARTGTDRDGCGGEVRWCFPSREAVTTSAQISSPSASELSAVAVRKPVLCAVERC